MKLHYGKFTVTPAPRKRGIIQEREYASQADLKRAEKLMARYWATQPVGYFNLFTNTVAENGVPRLYFCRNFSPAELAAAGFDSREFYADLRPVCGYPHPAVA